MNYFYRYLNPQTQAAFRFLVERSNSMFEMCCREDLSMDYQATFLKNIRDKAFKRGNTRNTPPTRDQLYVRLSSTEAVTKEALASLKKWQLFDLLATPCNSLSPRCLFGVDRRHVGGYQVLLAFYIDNGMSNLRSLDF